LAHTAIATWKLTLYVLDGALGHKDSMDTGSILHYGDVQRISAGSSVRHNGIQSLGDSTGAFPANLDSAERQRHFFEL
jgi:redox-sensitive bicupin YhaK (pirin superfamily)